VGFLQQPQLRTAQNQRGQGGPLALTLGEPCHRQVGQPTAKPESIDDDVEGGIVGAEIDAGRLRPKAQVLSDGQVRVQT